MYRANFTLLPKGREILMAALTAGPVPELAQHKPQLDLRTTTQQPSG